MTRRIFLGALAGLAAGTLAGCASAPPSSTELSAKRREIDAAADGAMARLYDKVAGSRELAGKAYGVLVFPSVKAGGLIVAGEYGEGALRIGGSTVGYYKTTAGSVGLTAGAQTKTVVLLFMTPAALQKFQADEGWTSGIDAGVALVKVGANAQMDTATLTAPVLGFVMTNAGLMAELSLESTKVTRLNIGP